MMMIVLMEIRAIIATHYGRLLNELNVGAV